MKTLIGALTALLLLGASVAEAEEPPLETVHSRHMVAEAMLTAHFVAAALRAGMAPAEINAVLADIADRSAITEFWIADETGQVVFTNVEGVDFSFPTDAGAGTQAAPFAALLDGSATVVVQDTGPREHDGKLFKYVGVAGVDGRRIVQIGIAAAEIGKP